MNTICYICENADNVIYTQTTFICKKCNIILRNKCDICGYKCNNRCLDIFKNTLKL